MAIHEIPREQWNAFLENFSLQHEGCLIKLESRRPGKGILCDAENSTLECVLTESADGHERVAIVTGEPAQKRETYFVSAPAHIRFCDASEAGRELLEIEGEDGGTIVLRFVNMHRHAA